MKQIQITTMLLAAMLATASCAATTGKANSAAKASASNAAVGASVTQTTASSQLDLKGVNAGSATTKKSSDPLTGGEWAGVGVAGVVGLTAGAAGIAVARMRYLRQMRILYQQRVNDSYETLNDDPEAVDALDLL